MRLIVNVYRFDPTAQTGPGYQKFEMDLDRRETVASALQYIYENIDPSLAFRFTCNMQKCGECAIIVNNTPCLACEKTVESEMRIDPLPNLPVIKDLVVDRHRVIKDILEKGPFLRKSTSLSRGQPACSAISSKTIRMGLCLECLCCQAACETLRLYPDQFVGPLGLLWFAQEVTAQEKSNEFSHQVEKILGMCDFCRTCLKACPDRKKPLAQAFSELFRYSKKGPSGKNRKQKHRPL